MLFAELQKKFRGTFSCCHCGTTGAWTPAAELAIEDVLTSYALGAICYLRPELVLAALLQRLGLPAAPSIVHVYPWPRESVAVVKEGTAEAVEVKCEPDALLDLGTSVVVLEAKRGELVDGDRTQLPEEAVVAHRCAGNRPWRLVCLTDDRREPRLAGFAVVDGVLERDRATLPASCAVASYFDAVGQMQAGADWVPPATVRDSVAQISWSELAVLLDGTASRRDVGEHERLLMTQLVAVLRSRGLARASFVGFSHGRTTTDLKWPQLSWFEEAWRTAMRSGLFGAIGGTDGFGSLAWPPGLEWMRMARSGSRFAGFANVRGGTAAWEMKDWLRRPPMRRRRL